MHLGEFFMENKDLYNDVLKSYYDTSFLEHHGILGMKWGVRRFQNKDGSLTAAGKDRYGTDQKSKKKPSPSAVSPLDNKNESHHSKDSNLSAAWFATKMALDVANLNPVGLGEDTVRLVKYLSASANKKKFEAERTGDIDTKTGFHKKTREYTQEEDLKRVNPEFNNFNTNTKNNCMLCTMTYDLRRRGCDVTALKASVGYTEDSLKEFYPKVKVEHVGNALVKNADGSRLSRKDLSANTISALASQGDGARGNLMVMWNLGGGHSMAYEVKNGKVEIYDGQSNKVTKNPEKILKSCYEVTYARLDNIEPDYKKMKEVCR